MGEKKEPGAMEWEKRLRTVVEKLDSLNAKRAELLAVRRSLLAEGWMAGHATQVKIAEITGLSRGRVQQLLLKLDR